MPNDSVTEWLKRWDDERQRLRTLLEAHTWRDVPLPHANRYLSTCPLCGAAVAVEQQQKHVDWHLRCLQ